jgi:hypothetical protein
VLVDPDGIVQLPLTQSVFPARPNQADADRMIDALSAYAVRMNAPLLPGDLTDEATRRVPTGQPRRRWPG